MQKQRAFTLIELLVVIAIIAVLIGLLFPAIGAIKTSVRQKENNVQVRNIIQSMITYSQNHRSFFPGFDGFTFVDLTNDSTGDTMRGWDAEGRYWALLDGNYTESGALVSPAETKSPWLSEEFTSDNYSFAMLQLTDAPSVNIDDRFRREEWRNEQNPLAPLVTDRLAGDEALAGQPSTYLSIHDGSKKGKWLGSIGYGDLSVEFSKTAEVETRFSTYHNTEDDIFTDSDGTGNGDEQLMNAALTYRGANNPLGDIE